MLSEYRTIFSPNQCFTAGQSSLIGIGNAHHFTSIIGHQVPGYRPANPSTPPNTSAFMSGYSLEV